MSAVEDPIVQYIIVRRSLNMSPGKLAAQVGHAVMMTCLRYAQIDAGQQVVAYESFQAFNTWLDTSYTKILLAASDRDWEKIKADPHWHCCVTDLGKTELQPNTETAIGFWPMRKSEAGKILSRLQVLKAPTLEESLDICGAAFGPTVYGLLRDGSQDEWHYDAQFMHDIASAALAWKERKAT